MILCRLSVWSGLENVGMMEKPLKQFKYLFEIRVALFLANFFTLYFVTLPSYIAPFYLDMCFFWICGSYANGVYFLSMMHRFRSNLATQICPAPLFQACRILHDGKCQNGGYSKTMYYKPGVSMPGHIYVDSQSRYSG